MIKYCQILIVSLLILLFSACTKQEDDRIIIASVGNRQITADEFALAYEFSPRQITQLGREEAFDMILAGMIKKSLFAKEAKKRGLLSKSFIQERVNYFERAAINRELFLHHIRDSIIINDDEMRQAYKRSNTTLFLKHFVSSNKIEAEQISQGKISATHVSLLNNGKNLKIKDIGEVDKISFNEVNQEIEDLIYSLPLLQLSEPFFDGKLYHIFYVIDKEINRMVTEKDFISRKSSLASAIRKRKEHYTAFHFVNRIMEPQNLIIKAESLNWMSEIINNEHKGTANLQYLGKNEIQSISNNKSEWMSKHIAEFKSGSLSIKDFIETYRMNPIEISYKNLLSIRKSLENIVAIYVRDRVFSDIGFFENLDKKQSVIDEKIFWEERLLANELKKNIFNNYKSQSLDSLELQKKYNREIESLAKKLQAQTKINVNRKELMLIKTSDEGLSRKVDFFAKHLQ